MVCPALIDLVTSPSEPHHVARVGLMAGWSHVTTVHMRYLVCDLVYWIFQGHMLKLKGTC